jgi:UDP-N-acetylmuramoylalanine--D-glutamate ligase
MRVVIAMRGPDAQAAERLLRGAGHDVSLGTALGGADMLVVDEWTPEHSPHVVKARNGGIPTAVLADFIIQRAPGPVVGVTGTAGKTSTCRALAHILRTAGDVVMISDTARSANAWPDHSLLTDDSGPTGPAGAILVAELTSTHLCHMGPVRPDVAVVTCIRPDHIELHGTADNYVAAKRRLVQDQDAHAAVVVPHDDPQTRDALGPLRARIWTFGAHDPGTDGCFADDTGVILRAGDREARTHVALPRPPLNRAALAAGSAAIALGHDPTVVARAMTALPPVAHRMSTRTGPRGICVVDDTMAATPLKAQAAIASLADARPVIVVGGDDALSGARVHATPQEEAMLAAGLQDAARAATTLIAFGPARARIATYVTADGEAPDIATALAMALDAAPDGGTVLVTPMFPLLPSDREWVAGVDGRHP